MLNVTINVTGRTLHDLRLAIDEARSLISRSFTSGADKINDGRYDFEVSGDAGDYPVKTSDGDSLFLNKGEVTAMIEAYNEQSGEDPVALADAMMNILDDEDDIPRSAIRQKVYDWAMANKLELVETI